MLLAKIFSFLGYIILSLFIIYLINLIVFLFKNKTSIKVGYFLALRAIKRANKLMIFAIISVMTATFLSLIVISGILSGLIEGSIISFREKSLGDIFISPLDKKTYIVNSENIIKVLKNDDRILGYSPRYSGSGSIEANYKTLKSDDIENKRNVSFTGIDPDLENKVTNLSANIKEGEYLKKEDASKYVLIGKDILQKYSVASDVDTTLLRDVSPGTKVRINISSTTNEYIVKGIIVIKNQEVGQKVYFVDKELQRLENLLPQDVKFISIKLKNRNEAKVVKENLINNGFSEFADIKTFEEGTPSFVVQMKQLFGVMGNLFGSVGIVVSAITLFIVIFINAITKRKQIGILKGIGINGFAIEFSYILQAIIYTSVGITIALFIVFILIKPAINANPINFPFSDGILVVENSTTIIRVIIFLIISIISGYLPAKMIVKRNTLDAILGR